jgi:hypothetical protein
MKFSLDFSLFIRMWAAKGRFKKITAELGALRSHAETKTSRLADVMVREGAAVRAAHGIPNVDRQLPYRIGERLIRVQTLLERRVRSAFAAGRNLSRGRR